MTIGFATGDTGQLVIDLKSTVTSFGMLGPVLYSLMIFIAILIPPIPDVPFVAVGAATFNYYTSVIFGLLGYFFAATVNFYISRFLSERLLKYLTTKHDRTQITKFSRYINFKSLVFFRLVPGISFGLISYAAGFTKVQYRQYILATVLGTTPWVLIAFLYINQILDNKEVFSTIGIFSAVILILLPIFAKVPKIKNWLLE